MTTVRLRDVPVAPEDREVTARPRRPGRGSFTTPLPPASLTPAQKRELERAAARKAVPPEFVQWCQDKGAGKRKILPWWEDPETRALFEKHPLGHQWKSRMGEVRKAEEEAAEKARVARVSAFLDSQAKSSQ